MTEKPSRSTATSHADPSRTRQPSRSQTGNAPGRPKPASQAKPNAQPAAAKLSAKQDRSASQPRAKVQPAPARQQAASQQEVVVFGKPISKADLFKLWGLLAFFIIVVVIIVMLWPYVGRMFDPAGREQLVSDIRNAGPAGVLMLLGLQFLQIIVAFIPGEVVQVAAGAIYGPWLGALVILVGCFFSSWLIYEVVHRLGQPFVEAMVPTKYLGRLRAFEEQGKLTPLVAILFLIPGLPKDVFTYLVPLTNMPRKTFLLTTTLARIPGILMSTYAASGLVEGNFASSIVIFVVLAIIAILAFLFKDKLLDLPGRR